MQFLEECVWTVVKYSSFFSVQTFLLKGNFYLKISFLMKLPKHSMSSVVSEWHSVFYGLESWIGVLVWCHGMEYWSGY